MGVSNAPHLRLTKHKQQILPLSPGRQLRAVLGHSEVVVALRPLPRFRQPVNRGPGVAHDVQKLGTQFLRRQLWCHLIRSVAAVVAVAAVTSGGGGGGGRERARGKGCGY